MFMFVFKNFAKIESYFFLKNSLTTIFKEQLFFHNKYSNAIEIKTFTNLASNKQDDLRKIENSGTAIFSRNTSFFLNKKSDVF